MPQCRPDRRTPRGQNIEEIRRRPDWGVDPGGRQRPDSRQQCLVVRIHLSDIQSRYVVRTQLINEVFGFDGVEQDFRTLLPKLYRPGRTPVCRRLSAFTAKV